MCLRTQRIMAIAVSVVLVYTTTFIHLLRFMKMTSLRECKDGQLQIHRRRWIVRMKPDRLQLMFLKNIEVIPHSTDLMLGQSMSDKIMGQLIQMKKTGTMLGCI